MVKSERTMARSLLRVLVVTAVLLSIPLVANQLSTEVTLTLFDFVLLGGLIMIPGLLYEWAAVTRNRNITAVATAAIAALGGAAMVAGEVDDAPGLILIGLALIGGAVVVGVRTGGHRRATPGDPVTGSAPESS